MWQALQLRVASLEEPVSLAEMKAHLRVDLDADDDLIAAQITEARETLEIEMRRTFLTTTWTVGLDAFPCGTGGLRLPRPPLQSIEAITYVDTDGVTQTLSPEVYGVDTLLEPGLVYRKANQSWPSLYDVPNAVQITYVAGWEDVLSVPAGIKSAIKLLVGHLYEAREATIEKAMTELPLGVCRLVWLYRILEAA